MAGARVSAEASESSHERKRVVERAGIVGAGTLASRVLGLARDVTIAALFTRRETDAFWVAFTIPNALRQLLGEGAVSSAVVPLLSGTIARDGDAAGRAFFARARGVSLVALAVATALGMIFAEELTSLFASGYRAVDGQFELTVSLTRVVFPYIFFMGSAALGMAALHANRRFAVASFAPALLNVAFLAACLVLPAAFVARGLSPVYALAVGALVGGALQVAAQIPELARLGYGGLPRLDLRDERVREMLRRIAPMTFGIGVYYVDLTLSRRFLSELGEGAQSYFAWAMRLCDFPQGIFVMAISTAALPSLSALAARGDHRELVAMWSLGLRLSLFVALPASMLLAIAGEPIVAMMFQRGHFDAVAAHETARALAWQGGAIFTVAGVRQIVPAFHALGDTRTPVAVSLLDLVAFVALALALRGPMGHVGVSAAVAGSSAVQLILLFALFVRRVGEVPWGELVRCVVRTGGASLGAALLAREAASATAQIVGVASWGRLAAGGAALVVFAVAFFGLASVLRAPELALVVGPIRRRLSRIGR